MRKTLAFLGVLLLCSVPVSAQRSGPSAPADVPAAPAAGHAAPAPSLFPTTDEVKSQVRAREETRDAHASAAMDSREFIALVAAIVVGVVIAAVILD
jgi:hypothetical protein